MKKESSVAGAKLMKTQNSGVGLPDGRYFTANLAEAMKKPVF